MTFPLVLAHPHIRRIIDREATVLILTRRIPVGTHEIHDALALRRNHAHRRRGRSYLQEEVLAFTIEIASRRTTTLEQLDLKTIRHAGFQTTEDFQADWLKRRRTIDPQQAVIVHTFRILADARYLHAQVHRGYTSTPGQAIPGEPEALTRHDLEQLDRKAARRDDPAFRQRASRAIGIRLKVAAARGDLLTIRIATAELAALTAGTAGTAVAS